MKGTRIPVGSRIQHLVETDVLGTVVDHGLDRIIVRWDDGIEASIYSVDLDQIRVVVTCATCKTLVPLKSACTNSLGRWTCLDCLYNV